MVISYSLHRLITQRKFGMYARVPVSTRLRATQASSPVASLITLEIIVLPEVLIAPASCGMSHLARRSKPSRVTTTRCSTPASTRRAISWRLRAQMEWRGSTMCSLALARQSCKVTRTRSVKSNLTRRATRSSLRRATRLAGSGAPRPAMRSSA